jgi:hypothetical protein
MQGLNRLQHVISDIIMTTSDPCGDKVVYFGVININENGRTIGSVDIWRSVITKEMFCEEKRLGVLQIADYIGMPKIDKDKKWAVAIRRNYNGHLRWRLIKIIKEGKMSFMDADDNTIEVNVKDFKIIDPSWWSFLVEENINRNMQVEDVPDK